MKKYISRLHYITNDHARFSHAEQVQMACAAGANWVQYRCFTKADAALLDDLHEIAAICDDWGATLIVTEHVHLVAKADVQGVHMENMDADLAAIRQLLGDDKTIGASANTFDDIRRQWLSGAVDYFGCGPFSVTHTKPNDFPLLGIAGYTSILQQLRSEGIDVPVLAIGGVGIADVVTLLAAGMYGIAVSSAVNGAPEPAAALRELYRLIY